MNSKTYSVRISNENDNQAIEDYAAKHGIPLSTAIARMLAAGLKSLSGKPVNTFAVIDPQATAFNIAAGEIRELARVLRHCVPALRRPRPLLEAERLPWEATIKKAETAFDSVKPAMTALKRAGKMEFYFLDLEYAKAEKIYAHAVADSKPVTATVFGALLGKPFKPTTSNKEEIKQTPATAA